MMIKLCQTATLRYMKGGDERGQEEIGGRVGGREGRKVVTREEE
jgi:hypothetical protein